MITVKMEKECGCFKRSDHESSRVCDSREEAEIYSQLLCEDMNETFCKKHCFSADDTADDEVTIRVAMND